MSLIDDDIKAKLRALYDEGRAYHNWTHVQAMLALFEEFRQLLTDEEAVLAGIAKLSGSARHLPHPGAT
jgi:predicted metal-dependent HD superfamily phosphohydrolase